MFQSQNMTVAASAMAERKTFEYRSKRVSHPAPCLFVAQQDRDHVAAFVVFCGLSAGLPAGDAGLYPFVVQRIPEHVAP